MAGHLDQPFTAEQEARIREIVLAGISASFEDQRRRYRKQLGATSRIDAIVQADEAADV